MPLRRPHTKSQAGCQRCKDKHIKCDEAQPACGACVRYNVPCVPKAPKTARAAKLAQAQRAQSVSSPSSQLSASPAPVSGPPVDTDTAQPPRTRSALSLWEFDLLHHWITEVAESFEISHGFNVAWRGQFIKAALQHEFFLHMIFMLSALHLALTKSPSFTEAHRAFILEGCSEATAQFRKEADNICDSNCHVVQGFPYLLSIYALALPQLDREDKGEEDVLDEMTQILGLIGSNGLVRNQVIPWMTQRGHDWWVKTEECYNDSGDIGWDLDLMRALGNLQPWIDSSDDDSITKAINTQAVQIFIRLHREFDLKKNLRPIPFPSGVDIEYPNLLRRRNPMAMVILTHYAVILWQCRDQWWCSNWGARVVSVVASMVPEKYAGALAWPLQMLDLHVPAKGSLFHILHSQDVGQ